jgi:hypothetical protein
MPPVDADRVAAMVEKILQNKVVSDATGGRDLAVVLVGQHEKGPLGSPVQLPPHEAGWWWMQIPRGIHGTKVWTPVQVRRASGAGGRIYLLAIVDDHHESVASIEPELWGPRIPYPTAK